MNTVGKSGEEWNTFYENKKIKFVFHISKKFNLQNVKLKSFKDTEHYRNMQEQFYK